MVKSKDFYEELNARAASAKQCIDFYASTCAKIHEADSYRSREEVLGAMSDEELVAYALGKYIVTLADTNTKVEHTASGTYRHVVTEMRILDHVVTTKRSDHIHERNAIMREILPGIDFSGDQMAAAVSDANFKDVQGAREYLYNLSLEELRAIAFPRLTIFAAGKLLDEGKKE